MMNKITYISILVVVGFLLVGAALQFPTAKYDFSEQMKLKKFSSYDELKNFVASAPGGVYTEMTLGATAIKSASESAPTGSEDYSTTNIQVAGVDEADIVKNDGKYIYTVTNNKIIIVDSYPAESAKILSEIALNGVQEIFLNGDKLIVFGNVYANPMPAGGVEKIAMPEYYPYRSGTFIKVYDISDRTKPTLTRNLTLTGNYFSSRMIGDYVYAIINQPVYGNPIPLPMVESGGIKKETPANQIFYFDYPDNYYQYTTILSLNTQNDNEDIKNKVILMGTTENTYVSMDNIYLAYMKRVSYTYMTERMIDVIVPLLPADVATKINEVSGSDSEKIQAIGTILDEYTNTLTDDERNLLQEKTQEKMDAIQNEIAKEMEKTIVQRISIQNGNIEHKATGEFPGRVLNQFSMDEYKNSFRVATTTSRFFGGGVLVRATSQQSVLTTAAKVADQPSEMNHIYVLDMDMKIVGKLEDLAKGESIHSARFMGSRVYLVTFKKTDPLFVIDLSEPTSPQVLGELKIPGYSDYLHPDDENHIIGVGKEAAEAEETGSSAPEVRRPLGFAWYQGVKISLFDVTDVAAPKEVSKFNIGDRGTDSYALYDHKAFLFNKNKKILVIPVLLAEIDKDKYSGDIPAWAYGDYKWQGAYIFNIDIESGITLKGRVTHNENDAEFMKTGFYYYNDASSVKRSLYIGNVLYTISGSLIKANDLATLDEMNKISLG